MQDMTIHQRSDKLYSEFPLKIVAFDPTDLCTWEGPCPCLCWRTGTACCGSWRWWRRSRSRTALTARKPSSSGRTSAWWTSPGCITYQRTYRSDWSIIKQETAASFSRLYGLDNWIDIFLSCLFNFCVLFNTAQHSQCLTLSNTAPVCSSHRRFSGWRFSSVPFLCVFRWWRGSGGSGLGSVSILKRYINCENC